MDARFELIAPDGKVWNEFALARADDPPKLADSLKPLYGVLVLSVDDDTETAITDDFDIMMQQVCLRSAEQLVRGNPVTYNLAAHPETVTFALEGDRVRISGDAIDTLVCDRADLVEALLDCGERFVQFKTAQLGAARAALYRDDLDAARAAASANDDDADLTSEDDDL